MNIATVKLDAPVVKQASILDAITEYGTALAKYRGAGGEVIPHALSAGLGAGAQQATNRMLRGKLYNNPKLLKALELSSATALGGGAGLAGALAAPLSKNINQATAGSAAKQLAELTAMGSGAELALSPAVTGLTGGSMGISESLSKLLGGGALGLGGQIAKDRRQLGVLRDAYLSGAKLPRGIDPKALQMSLKDNIAARYKGLGIPEGGLSAAAGASLMAAGNPYLGSAALLTAPLQNTRASKYMGDVLRDLRAGAAKTKEVKKTKDTIDGLYKSSSVAIKLAAPVYRTRPEYCLDAPTYEKLGFMTRAFKGLAEGLSHNSFFVPAKDIGSGALGQSFKGFFRGLGQDIGAGARKIQGQGEKFRVRKGSKRVADTATLQGAAPHNAPQVGEQALLQERNIGKLNPLEAATNPTKAVQDAELTPITSEVPAYEPLFQNPTTPGEKFQEGLSKFKDVVSRPFREGYQQVRQQQLSPYARTEQGASELAELGSILPKNRGQAGRAQATIEAGGGTTAQDLARQATTAPTATPVTHGFRGGRVEVTDAALAEVEGLSGGINNNNVRVRLQNIEDQISTAVAGGTNRTDAISSRSAQDRAFFELANPYSTRGRTGNVQVRGSSGAELRNAVRDARQKLTTSQNKQQAATQNVAQNPLTPPVQRAAPPRSQLAAPTQQSADLAAAEQAQQLPGALGEAQSAAQMRVRAPGKGLLTDTQQGAEIANLRFAETELGQNLAQIEGAGGLGTNPLTKNIKAAREAAVKDSQLHTAAAENAKATEALNTQVSASISSAQHQPQVQQILRDLGKQNTEVNAQTVVRELERRLSAAPNSLAGVEAEVSNLLATPAGQEFARTQQQLNVRMGQYNAAIEANLEKQLVKIETSGKNKLAKTVKKLTEQKSGLPGRRQNVRSTQEVGVIQEIQALAESRARILQDSSLGGGNIAARTQAAEIMRATEEALATGTSQDLIKLRQTLATPGEAIVTRGKPSKINKLLDTVNRNVGTSFTAEQEKAFREIVKMEGRGAGDQVKATRDIFSAQAARSPNTTQPRELNQVLTEAENAVGNSASGQAENIVNLGRQEGGAGASAFNKLTGGNPAGYQAQNYTVAELELMAGNNPLGYTYGGAGASQFERFIINGKGTISENAAALDKEIVRLENQLRGLGNRANNTQRTAIEDAIIAHRAAQSEVNNYIRAQQGHLTPTFQTAQQAESGAQRLVQNDMRMGNITLINDASKVQKPRGLDIKGAREALEGSLTTDPAQHSNLVNNIFAQLKRENPAIQDDAIARWMVDSNLISQKQLAAMGGAQQLAGGMAGQAAGPGMGAAIATTAAAGGLGTFAMTGRNPGPATQAQQEMLKKRSSWRINPLQAPVILSKLSSPVKPIPLESTKPKLPKVKDMVAESPLTATVEGVQNALRAPVRA